ncbi:DUF1642 domain-containing protein [Lacticaseibacillus paracasei]|uniref:DUF1642 domain-containing protein n=1 Tax=Lacticaseibacillus paracasei TaxID=1597 RepID=UPI0025A1E159|nr:DUF1642 domain-containing protein [Lacticaseibacillus paracasei]MDM7528851.1 hypothetical protein [Lacticaseibacillus paracasei]MDM7540912.1 hypothetical protein [Lacticaseibacillus paracasei]
MSNETKRDVLLYFGDYVLRNFNTPNIIFGGKQVAEYMQRYDAALPDDLPVIPKAVGEWIRRCKGKGGAGNVSDAMIYEQGSIATWLYNERHSDIFARAWVLGVWKVKKTGEIVKLEAEK